MTTQHSSYRENIDATFADMTRRDRENPHNRRPRTPCPPTRLNTDNIKSSKVNWLWPGFIPRGHVSLLCGPPGSGKSILALDLIARLTSAKGWPDGQSIT